MNNYEWDQSSPHEQPVDLGRIGMFIFGAIAGAGLMYLLDPRGGARRRALIRDQVLHVGRSARMYGGKLARRAKNEVRGGIEEQKAWWRERDERIDDDVLVERVRAQLGHVLSHPGAVHVTANDGTITLRGLVLHGEIRKVCDRLEATRGVRNYNIELGEHDTIERLSGREGESRLRSGRRIG